jgi:hypothetical protein
MFNVVIEDEKEPITVQVENHLVEWWVNRFNLSAKRMGSNFTARATTQIEPAPHPDEVLNSLMSVEASHA